MVGRPREFDLDRALDAAMQAFWAKGYEATSMADLMSATGLHKGSIYRAFGDKHALFVEALNRYLADMRETERSVLEHAATPLEGLRMAAHHVLDMADCDEQIPRGCLAVNALVEMAPHDAVIHGILGNHMKFMRETISDAVSDAQAAGQMSGDRPPELVAAVLMTFMAGLATTMKSGITKDDAHRLLDAQLDAIFL